MKIKLLPLAVAGCLLSSTSYGEIHLSGFASVVGGMTTSSDETLYGYEDSFDFKEGSLFALQASSDLEQGLGVTVQVAAKGEDDWDPEFKWAYLSYDASDNLRLLAGRQRAPFYMYSDYLDVSYAYPWISPPKGVYDLIFDTFDGLGAIYTANFGDLDASFHGIFGRNTDEIDAFGESLDIEVNDMTGLATTLNYDWLTLRASYFMGEISLPHSDLEALADGWELFGYSSESDNTRIYEDDATFLEFGFQMNFDSVILIGEYTELEIDDTPLAEEESYYVMAGYQFDSVLVHITYGVDDNSVDNYAEDITYMSPTDPNNPLDPANIFNTIKGGTEQLIVEQESEEDYITIGARYDFHDSAALKFEYTDFADDNDSKRDAGLFRMALVTVF